MEALHVQGILVIARLQEFFKPYGEAMVVTTGFGSPKSAFVYYFPVVFFCRPASGIKVLWTASMAEWLNSVFKWLLFGERPYWWVHTSGLYNDTDHGLTQFSVTCETGPGSPSGHVMVPAAVWFVIIKEFTTHARLSRTMSALLWLTYAVFLAVIGVSRCFLLAHFPHQIVGGILAGANLGMLCNRIPALELRFKTYVVVSVLQIVVGASIYGLLWLFEVDAMWTLPLALKWCARKEWVHLNTTPFYCYVRDASALLGTGVAVKFLNARCDQLRKSFGLLCALPMSVAALLFIHAVESVHLPDDPTWMFYSLACVKWLAFPWTVLVLVPGLFSGVASIWKSDKVE